MSKLGIAVEHLGASQLNYHLIRQTNNFVGTAWDRDVVVFYQHLVKPLMAMNFAAMQMNECWGYDGPVVATSFRTAEQLLRFPCPTKKLYYIWDLEWMRLPNKSFEALRAVYGSEKLKLLARSYDHANVIAKAFNVDVTVVENFNLPVIAEMAK